jgi:hypothetical protein
MEEQLQLEDGAFCLVGHQSLGAADHVIFD